MIFTLFRTIWIHGFTAAVIFTFRVNAFFFVGVIVVRNESSGILMVVGFPILVSEAIALCLPHLLLINEVFIFCFSIIVEDLFLFHFFLLTFEFINQLLLILSSLGVFKIIHIKLMFKIINVSVFFNIDHVQAFHFILKSLILFLVLWFYILNTFQPFFNSIKFLFPSGNFVNELFFIKFHLFNRVFHVGHFSCLILNNTANTLLNISLFSIGI